MKSALAATAILFAAACPALLAANAALAAGGAGAPNQPASQLQVAMTIYAGGITLGKMDMDATLRGGEYHVVSNLTTSGVINAFWQSEIQAASSGKVEAHAFAPTLYDSYDTRATRKQQVSLSYDGDAAPRLFAEPAYSTTGFEVKPEDTKGTLDPLSAITFIFSGVGARGADPCSFAVPVFDGRRRYNVEMSKVRDVDIHMDNGLYQGKGVQCDVKYHQIAGFRPRVLKSNESFPVIHAWFVRLPSAVAGRDYTVPVRIWADTKYGVMAVLANSIRVDGAAPKSVKP